MFKNSSLNRSGWSWQSSSRSVISSIASQVLIPFPQTFGQFDQADFRRRFTVPEVVIFAKLDQGGPLGFELGALDAVLVDSQLLDEMTQAQSFGQLQVHFDPALFVDVDEIQQVAGREILAPA